VQDVRERSGHRHPLLQHVSGAEQQGGEDTDQIDHRRLSAAAVSAFIVRIITI
jgi:hypothetical protein